MKKEIKLENCYFTSQPDLWKDLHLLAMKYKNMNIFQRLIFKIKARLFKPKLNYKDINLLNDCTYLQDRIEHSVKSYNEIIKE